MSVVCGRSLPLATAGQPCNGSRQRYCVRDSYDSKTWSSSFSFSSTIIEFAEVSTCLFPSIPIQSSVVFRFPLNIFFPARSVRLLWDMTVHHRFSSFKTRFVAYLSLATILPRLPVLPLLRSVLCTTVAIPRFHVLEFIYRYNRSLPVVFMLNIVRLSTSAAIFLHVFFGPL